jgi:hypothetical protein
VQDAASCLVCLSLWVWQWVTLTGLLGMLLLLLLGLKKHCVAEQQAAGLAQGATCPFQPLQTVWC